MYSNTDQSLTAHFVCPDDCPIELSFLKDLPNCSLFLASLGFLLTLNIDDSTCADYD